MRRRKILVFQHVPFEPLGTLDPILRERGFRIRYVNFGRHPHARPSLARYGGLIVLGGPMNADQTDAFPHLAVEVELIREAVERGMRVLGICLGAQLLARAFGAPVAAGTCREIGWHDVQVTAAAGDDPVLGAFDRSERLFQWHHDGFGLPDAAVGLATSPACPQQAFRLGDHAHGLQFHLEADEALIERWLTLPAHAPELAAAGLDPGAIRAETASRIVGMVRLGRVTFGRWADTFALQTPRRLLRSR